MNFIIYNSTGTILRTGSCPNSMLSIQAQNGETVIEGVANDQTQYIADGEVTDYTTEQLAAKSSVPYGYKWNPATMSAIQTATDSEITAYLATQARAKRDQLLTASDWTQTADQSDAIKAKWQSYRQDLRDITEQAGFPNTITWPT